jgi:hypothetical protein
MASITTFVNKAEDALPILKKIADLNEKASTIVSKIIDDVATNAHYAYQKMSSKLDDVIELFVKHGDNINFTNAVSKLDGDDLLKTKNIIEYCADNYSDNMVEEVSDAIKDTSNFPNAYDTCVSEQKNINRVVGESGDAKGKVDEIAKAYDEDGAAGVKREIIDNAHNDTIETVFEKNNIGNNNLSIRQNVIDDVINETLKGNKNFTSQYVLTGDEAIQLGIDFLGTGYKEIGLPNSGVFRNTVNGQIRQFRMDIKSLCGDHPPNLPHVHLEIINANNRAVINNHIIFEE